MNDYCVMGQKFGYFLLGNICGWLSFGLLLYLMNGI